MDDMRLCYILAVRVAKSTGLHWRELIGAAWEGFAQAERSYDHSTGARFSTYASYRIRGQIFDYLRSLQSAGIRRRDRDSERSSVFSLDVLDRDSDIRLGGAALGRSGECTHCSAMEHAAEILSGRELEIVRLRMEGYANREIAAGLGISEPRISQILHDVGQRLVMAGHIDPPTSTRRRRVYTMERTKKEKKRAALPVSG